MALDLKANLGKFLPFMDFVLNMNFIEQPKVLQQWKIIKANIEQNKTFQNQKTLIDVFSKVIRSRYYELVAKSLPVPKELAKVFAVDMPVEVNIDLCSSDEDSDDVEFVLKETELDQNATRAPVRQTQTLVQQEMPPTSLVSSAPCVKTSDYRTPSLSSRDPRLQKKLAASAGVAPTQSQMLQPESMPHWNNVELQPYLNMQQNSKEQQMPLQSQWMMPQEATTRIPWFSMQQQQQPISFNQSMPMIFMQQQQQQQQIPAQTTQWFASAENATTSSRTFTKAHLNYGEYRKQKEQERANAQNGSEVNSNFQNIATSTRRVNEQNSNARNTTTHAANANTVNNGKSKSVPRKTAITMNKRIESINKTVQKPKQGRSKIPHMEKELQKLNCTFIGFNDVSDYVMVGNRRQSSIKATQRIEQLQRYSEINDRNDRYEKQTTKRTGINESDTSNNPYIAKLKKEFKQKKTAQEKQKNATKRKQLSQYKKGTQNNSIIQTANTNKRMMEHINKKCVLCGSKPGNLVWHFVNAHKTESYVSRLGKIKLNYLEHNIPFAVIAPNGNDCSVECYFCKKIIKGRFHQFHEHFSEHTGEFAFKCKGCDHQEPNLLKLRKHTGRATMCRDQAFKKQYSYRKQTVIQLFCCTECNFLQLNQANIWKHLEKHHGILAPQSYAELIKSYTIAALQDQIHHDNDNNSDISIEEFQHNRNYDDAVSIQNEPIQNEEAVDQIDQNNTLHYDNADVERIFAQLLNSNVAVVASESLFSDLYNEPTALANVALPSKSLQAKVIKCKGFKHYPKNVLHYFGFYKCAAEDCYFSTDVEDDLLQHLVAHSKYKMPSKNYLECVYCNRNVTINQSNLPQDLVVHIRLQHPFTRYQCLCCTYRSTDPFNVVSHSRHSHGIHQNMVYDCMNPKKNPQQANNNADDLAKVKASMLQHVKPFACKVNDCKATFYALSSWEMHLKQKHPFNTAAALPNVSEWCCPYCNREAPDERQIRAHLTYHHPAMPIYVCKRQLVEGATVDAAANMVIKSLTMPVPAERIIKVHQNAIEAASFANKQLEKDLEEKELKELQDNIKILLLKLTYKTGVSPDALYRCCSKTCLGYFSTFANLKKHIELRGHQTTYCWLQCPHCPDNDDNKYTMDIFEAHLCSHSRHLFVCLECGDSFGGEQQLQQHSQQHHAQFATMRLKKLSYNLCYSYHLLCDAKMPSKDLEFLKACRALLTKHIKQQEKMEAALLKRQWRVDENCVWLDNFPKYISSTDQKINCVECGMLCHSIKMLLQHVASSHANSNKCIIPTCTHIILPDQQQLQQHVNEHLSENLFVCCACREYEYYLTQKNIVDHIREKHDLRDVPMLQLQRTNMETKVSLAILFAQGKKSFSRTSIKCFACDRCQMTAEQYENHLTRSHMMTMERYCQLCDYKLKENNEMKHFRKKHAGENLKVRVEFKNMHNVIIKSIHYLEIEIEGMAVKACKRPQPEDNDADNSESAGRKPRTIDEEVLQTKEERQLAIVDETETAASDFSDAEDDDVIPVARIIRQQLLLNKSLQNNCS